MTFVPFHDADDIGDRFLALISKHNIPVPFKPRFADYARLVSRSDA